MDVRLVAAIVFVLLLAAGALGVLISQRVLQQDGTGSNVAPVQGAAFGILALLLAFSFSVGLARYDARRTIIVSEANAITTLWYRSALMAVFLLGTGYRRSYRHAAVAIGGIALVIAVVFTAITDLDRPLDGSIRLNVQPLRQAQSEIAYAGTASRISGNAILSS